MRPTARRGVPQAGRICGVQHGSAVSSRDLHTDCTASARVMTSVTARNATEPRRTMRSSHADPDGAPAQQCASSAGMAAGNDRGARAAIRAGLGHPASISPLAALDVRKFVAGVPSSSHASCAVQYASMIDRWRQRATPGNFSLSPRPDGRPILQAHCCQTAG